TRSDDARAPDDKIPDKARQAQLAERRADLSAGIGVVERRRESGRARREISGRFFLKQRIKDGAVKIAGERPGEKSRERQRLKTIGEGEDLLREAGRKPADDRERKNDDNAKINNSHYSTPDTTVSLYILNRREKIIIKRG
ncbi:MAG: hypothetical protein WBK52_05105, partial [Bacilli bacterium]